jgi:hypothetical protein
MKKWYSSRTIWFAIITGIAGVITAFATQFPEVGWLITLASMANVVLRLVTTQEIK